ncbi:hypothetical protein ACFLRY_00915 [Bacteroidota bacterium]
MKIRFNKQQCHAIIPLMVYSLDQHPDPFREYGYAYFMFDSLLTDKINRFHNNFENGSDRVSKRYIEIDRYITLLNNDYELDNKKNKEISLSDIKLDLINLFSEKPELPDENETYNINGYFVATRNGFKISVDRIPDGLSYPTIIYESFFMNYLTISKIITVD